MKANPVFPGAGYFSVGSPEWAATTDYSTGLDHLRTIWDHCLPETCPMMQDENKTDCVGCKYAPPRVKIPQEYGIKRHKFVDLYDPVIGAT